MKMANPLFNQLQPKNGLNNFKQQVMNMRNSIPNPRDEVQRLLNSGQMSQEQFNQLSQMAQQILPQLGL